MSRRLIFKGFEILPDERKLLVDGNLKLLGARAFDLLMWLAEHRARVVSKDELLQNVWPGTVVEESNLTVHVAVLRKLLGLQVITTVVGRGYRFTAAMTADADLAALPLPLPELSPSAGNELSRPPPPPIDRPSLAVLPFANSGGDAGEDYFAEGIAEDIITELSRLRSLYVIARQSSFSFNRKVKRLAEIAGELGVSFVVDGSVRRFDNRVRITTQLIEASSGKEIWGDRFDVPVEQIFAVQDDIVRTIVTTLEGRMTNLILQHSRRKTPSSITAYEYFLQARQKTEIYDVLASLPVLRKAIQLDPDYAPAHALLGLALLVEYLNTGDPVKIESAWQATAKSVELDDGDAFCHCALADILIYRGKFDLAQAHFERALAINPSDIWALTLSADLWIAVGDAERAINVLDRAHQRDPYPPNYYWGLRGPALMMLGRFEEAIVALDRSMSVNVSREGYLAICHARQGNMAQARQHVAEALRIEPELTISRFVETESFQKQQDRAYLAEGLRLAGMPVEAFFYWST